MVKKSGKSGKVKGGKVQDKLIRKLEAEQNGKGLAQFGSEAARALFVTKTLHEVNYRVF